ncbi:MAG: DSD1 family PLP-dependent enzyme, partial [Deltaproteobacteria bacterium]|nr:DSD1 family PLP-dependent enzyme [Deltaproteobacteria bacterium]
IGRHKSELDTPALLLDMDALEANIGRMADWFADKKCDLRPHTKTHKLPLIAHKQIEAGAIGVTCSRVSEAKVFFEHGIKDILIAYEIVGEQKIRRLVNLTKYGRLIVAIDDLENARQISDAAGAAGARVDVVVDVDVGLNRCAIKPGQPALDLVQGIDRLPNINFRGLMGYEGGLFIKDEADKIRQCEQANRELVETKELIEKNGFPVEIVSAGGSNTYYLTGIYPGITDVEVGSYVTMDLNNRDHGLDFEQAVTILATVISRPESDRVIVDAGRYSLSLDFGPPACLDKGLNFSALHEHHGLWTITDSQRPWRVGDKVEFVPSHGCTTIPRHDHYLLLRQDRVESVIEIAARGTLF